MKKVQSWSNPLYNVQRFDLIREYESCATDEELCNFFHSALEKEKDNKLVIRILWMLIDFSTGITNQSINVLWN